MSYGNVPWNPLLLISGEGITNNPPDMAIPICCCILPDKNGAPEDVPPTYPPSLTIRPPQPKYNGLP